MWRTSISMMRLKVWSLSKSINCFVMLFYSNGKFSSSLTNITSITMTLTTFQAKNTIIFKWISIAHCLELLFFPFWISVKKNYTNFTLHLLHSKCKFEWKMYTWNWQHHVDDAIYLSTFATPLQLTTSTPSVSIITDFTFLHMQFL